MQRFLMLVGDHLRSTRSATQVRLSSNYRNLAISPTIQVRQPWPYQRVHGSMVNWRDAQGNSLFAHQLLLPTLGALNQNAHWRFYANVETGAWLPDVDFDSLLAYPQHLSESMLFPFEAEYSHETGPFQMTTRHITVTRLGEAEEPWVDDMYGLICQAREGRRRIDVPFCDLDVKKRNPNRRLVADYSYWFSNYR